MDNHIQEIRESHQPYISQQKLADTIGVSRTTIQALESGKTRAVNQHLPAIAGVLGCSIDDFVYGKEEAARLYAKMHSYGSEIEQALRQEYDAKLEEKELEIRRIQSEYDDLIVAYHSLEQVTAFQRKQLDKAAEKC